MTDLNLDFDFYYSCLLNLAINPSLLYIIIFMSGLFASRALYYKVATVLSLWPLVGKHLTLLSP